MILKFETNAVDQLEDAVQYYQDISPKLGESFKNDVKNMIQSILNFPNIWQIRYSNVRIAHLKRFPYSLHYKLKSNAVIVILVLHQKRLRD